MRKNRSSRKARKLLQRKHPCLYKIYADDCVVATETDGVVTVTAVDPSFDKNKTLSFDCNKRILLSQLYEGKSLQPHNRFDIADMAVDRRKEKCEIKIPPHSIAMIQY